MGLVSGETAALVFLAAMFLIGSMFGCILAGVLEADNETLSLYVWEYLALLENDEIRPVLQTVFFDVFLFPSLVFLVGFTALGMLGTPLLFAARGFLFCFAVSSFYRLFGMSGALIACFLFGLSAIVWFPAFFWLGTQGILASYSLLRRAAGDGRYPLRYDYRFLMRSAICVFVLCFCVTLEYLVVPVLVRTVAGAL